MTPFQPLVSAERRPAVAVGWWQQTRGAALMTGDLLPPRDG